MWTAILIILLVVLALVLAGGAFGLGPGPVRRRTIVERRAPAPVVVDEYVERPATVVEEAPVVREAVVDPAPVVRRRRFIR